jgi:Tfp pilus assembly ATPase PilU
MIEKGASDLHITTGSPPQLRIDGRLVPLKTPPLTFISGSNEARDLMRVSGLGRVRRCQLHAVIL